MSARTDVSRPFQVHHCRYGILGLLRVMSIYFTRSVSTHDQARSLASRDAWGKRISGADLAHHFWGHFPYLSFRNLFFLPSHLFSYPPLPLSAKKWQLSPTRRYGERCELSQWGPERSPGCKIILIYLEAKKNSNHFGYFVGTKISVWSFWTTCGHQFRLHRVIWPIDRLQRGSRGRMAQTWWGNT